MFTQTTEIRHQTVAFLPHTFRHRSGLVNDGRLQEYTVSAYWHEFRGGQHRAVFGAVCLYLESEALPVAPRALTYQQGLQMADRTGLHAIDTSVTFAAAEKMGVKTYHAAGMYRPDVYNQLPAYVNQTDYEEGLLLRMLTHPDRVPAGADGWYRFQRSNSQPASS